MIRSLQHINVIMPRLPVVCCLLAALQVPLMQCARHLPPWPLDAQLHLLPRCVCLLRSVSCMTCSGSSGSGGAGSGCISGDAVRLAHVKRIVPRDKHCGCFFGVAIALLSLFLNLQSSVPCLLQSKRGLRSSKASAGSKASGSLSSKGGLAAAAASGKATLPLDKGRTTGSSTSSGMAGLRPPSSSRLASHLNLQQLQQQPPPPLQQP